MMSLKIMDSIKIVTYRSDMDNLGGPESSPNR